MHSHPYASKCILPADDADVFVIFPYNDSLQVPCSPDAFLSSKRRAHILPHPPHDFYLALVLV
jgi:hypothetical protein